MFMKDALGKTVQAGDRVVVMPDHENYGDEAKPWFGWIHRVEERLAVFQGKPGAYVHDGKKDCEPASSKSVNTIAWLKSSQFVRVKA